MRACIPPQGGSLPGSGLELGIPQRANEIANSFCSQLFTACNSSILIFKSQVSSIGTLSGYKVGLAGG